MKKKLLILFLFISFLNFKVGAQNDDWAKLNRFVEENIKLSEQENDGKRVVFLGNSITEGWIKTHPDFFKENGYISRGIGGQTSYQFLLRFRDDVVNLKPKIVVINAGTNDIAENTCSYNSERTFGNIVSMVGIAKANKIKVILTSVLPADHFPWRKDIKNVTEKIEALNSKIKEYAKKRKIKYVDYYSSIVDDKGASAKEYTRDGVHPKAEGYTVMEGLIKPVIEKMR